MSSSAVSSAKAGSSSAARPVLKNLTRARVPRAGLIGFSLAASAAIAWKFLVSDRHKHKISSFYKFNLDVFLLCKRA
ncbi:unnamed protein product [Rotaria sp. Silwood2]|nr:unnamed protein product [Rotaria sp. Silwood2]CAF3195614.1 unnamed protein product [Rotaria sp. Silwood2]